MTDPDQRILESVRAAIGAGRLASCIVYLDQETWPAGKQQTLGDVRVEVPWDAHMTFVDLEPGVNWGHECCYLAVRLEAEDILQVPARMPPFLKAGSSKFRLLWRGPGAPEWAVAV